MCNCKAYKQAQKEHMKAGPHYEMVNDFICPMCNSLEKTYGVHAPTIDYATYSHECSACHSYIRYTHEDSETKEDTGISSHEEFYYNKDIEYIMFDYRSDINEQTLACVNDKIIYLPKLEFTNKEDFYNKIKVLAVFR